MQDPTAATLHRYRPDIDGLRAIAVLAVVLYHTGFGVPGGYVGVDVFFVISGYLITGIVHREAEAGRFSFGGFYERRARRILPALFVVLAASTAAAAMLLLPTDFSRFGASLLATLAFVSNFHFWAQGSYFGPAAEMQPLLHTWSLSVEEQFYLLLPPFLLLVRRWLPARIALSLAVVAGLSLVAACVLVALQPHAVFYWSPFRAWELAIGGWLAVVQPARPSRPALRSALAAAAFVLLGIAIFGFDDDTLFPGAAALLPCVGTALLIWLGTGDAGSWYARLLSLRPLVFFGLISYSLYLWHWPLAVYARHALGTAELPATVRVGVVVASVLFAWASWRWVETPFRSARRVGRAALVRWAVAGTLACAAVGAVVAAGAGWPARFAPDVVALDRARQKQPYREDCLNPAFPRTLAEGCRIGAEGAPTVLVWGDSYAFAMLPALDRAFAVLDVAGVFVARTGCPPLPALQVSLRGRQNWRCTEFNGHMMDLIRASDGLDAVVLSAAWNEYVESDGGYALDARTGADATGPLRSGTESLLDALGAADVGRVVVIEQVPSYDWNVPYRMALAAARGEPMPRMSRREHEGHAAAAHAVFDALRREGRLLTIRPEEWLCAGEQCEYADGAGVPYYFDHGHLSRHGAERITPMLTDALSGALASTAQQQGTEIR